MDLKEQMMNEYQKKDIEKLKEAIAATMKMGKMRCIIEQIKSMMRFEKNFKRVVLLLKTIPMYIQKKRV